jgi:hypothetical protein
MRTALNADAILRQHNGRQFRTRSPVLKRSLADIVAAGRAGSAEFAELRALSPRPLRGPPLTRSVRRNRRSCS